ncbi:uncharacterized protein LOC129894108 [Solanum dulcamara]|uniref:uncharacterized protein LOC129894108 n=1 Tax=Solanum dulcamara TaxID=45834 RepID=UPI0024860DDB|nr:uncharacterized protein LOC129894108 [Solanum dulcamara]
MTLENYVKLIDQSLRSHVEQNLHLEQFILTYRDPKLDSHLDTWIDMAIKLNVTVLGIYPFFLRSYSLPDVIYAAKKLTKLWLSRCKFEFDINATHIRFCCLEDLYLHHVHISDAQLQRVINRSPFIRTLNLLACQGINKLQVFGLVHLENLIVELCKLDSVIVQAPNLQYFRYTECTDHPCEISILDGYNTLQTLALTGASITDQQFRDVSYKFPNISELNLARCYKLKYIEIQSEKLMNFTLAGLQSLEEVTIEAPNLLKFNFNGDKMPFSSMDPSSLETARLNFFSPSTVRSKFGDVDSSWYTNLHHFVRKFNYSKGLMLVIFCRKTKHVLIYENSTEIVIPPSHDVEIFIAPIPRVESIIGTLMFNYPKMMSILPCTHSKALQVLSGLKGCTQKQKCGKECPFNTEFSHRYRKLEEVISCTGTSEEGMTSIWYSWLKSTSLIDQVTNFMLKWKV